MEVDPALAITDLRGALTTLLTGVTIDRLLLAPTRTAPVGIGGFVGMSRSPRGEVGGVRVDAVARVAVVATSRTNLESAAEQVLATLVGAPRSTLVPLGIQRLVLADAGAVESLTGGRVERVLSFSVDYEFQQAPEDPEGIIERVPLELETVDVTEGAVLDAAFTPASLAWFDAVDDPRATLGGPSQWTYVADTRSIEHHSNIRGGQNTPNANKPGTYLVLRATPDRPPLRDLVLETAFRSEDANGGVGLVFRYQNPFTFYFFLMDPQANYRMLARKIDGAFSQLEGGALDTTASFATHTDSTLRLEASGTDFAVFLDDQPILSGSDSAILAPGRVGFMARRNARLAFRRVRVVPT